MTLAAADIAVGFLAGGQARRMGGGDKARLLVGGRSILDWQLAATSQHRLRLISANGDPDRFADTGLPVVSDEAGGEFLGPLAGILALMDWLASCPQTKGRPGWLLTLATDAPFVPADLADRLAAALLAEGADIAQARSNGRRHPVFALWPLHLAGDLRGAIQQEGMRKIDDFTDRHHLAIAEFSGLPDPFFNINSPADLAAADNLV